MASGLCCLSLLEQLRLGVGWAEMGTGQELGIKAGSNPSLQGKLLLHHGNPSLSPFHILCFGAWTLPRSPANIHNTLAVAHP